MSSTDSQAVSIATEQFLKDEPLSDLKNFDILFFDKKEVFEVVFVPKLPPKEMGITSMPVVTQITLGR